MMDDQPTPLDFLKAVYLNEGLPLTVRMRAAIEAAPYMASEAWGCCGGVYVGGRFRGEVGQSASAL